MILFIYNCTDSKNTNTFDGNWSWEKNSQDQTFTINIKKIDDTYYGSYCAIAQAGNRIDCGVEGDDPSFRISNVKNNDVVISFKSNYSLAIGKVRLKLVEDKLSWEIIEKPEGDFFCPYNAILIKQNSNK